MSTHKPVYGDACVVWSDHNYELIRLNNTCFVLPQWLDVLDMFSEFSKDEWDYILYNVLEGTVDLRIKLIAGERYRVCGGNWDSDFVEFEIDSEQTMVKLLPELLDMLA